MRQNVCPPCPSWDPARPSSFREAYLPFIHTAFGRLSWLVNRRVSGLAIENSFITNCRRNLLYSRLRGPSRRGVYRPGKWVSSSSFFPRMPDFHPPPAGDQWAAHLFILIKAHPPTFRSVLSLYSQANHC